MVETVGFRQVMWHVMLKYAKGRILGVDTLGQHVPYLCDILCELPEPPGAKGATVCRKPQHCKRGRVSGL
jgi:hypothetical protein